MCREFRYSDFEFVFNVMEIVIIILLIIALVVLVWMILEIRRTTSELKGKAGTEQSFILLQQQMSQVRDTLNMQLEFVRRQLVDSGTAINERMTSASSMFGEIQKGIGGLNRASEHILAVGKDISTLHDILRSPKLRGGLGEYFLSQILHQILPSHNISEQHRFSSGEIVDAVIRMGGRLLPIDAKFPLENIRHMMESKTDDERESFRKMFISDIKKHLNTIADKYILPDEGTFDFAFMYIPAENVYYEIISNTDEFQNIIEHSMSKKVFFVSPSTLCAHLQIIILGLKGLTIERNARVILDRMARLKTDIDRFAEDFNILGKHLGNTRTKYDDAEKRLSRLIERIADIDRT